MGHTVDRDDIKHALGELLPVIGVRDHFPAPQQLSPIGLKDAERSVQAVAHHMGLPVRIELSFVGEGAAGEDGTFDTASLARKTAWGGGESITAQVGMPESLPLYGSSQLKDFPIRVKVSEGCMAQPRTFVAIMAHELSHVLLRSLGHPECDNEVYTDLTAMLMGFSEIMDQGRKVVRRTARGERVQTHTTTYGYLEDYEFDFALLRVNTLLEQYSATKKEIARVAESVLQDCRSAEESLADFQKLLGYLDTHVDRRTKKRDAARLVACHAPAYTEPLQNAIFQGERVATKAAEAANRISWYNESTATSLEVHRGPLVSAKEALAAAHERIRSDCEVLRRNIGFFARRRLAKERRMRTSP